MARSTVAVRFIGETRDLKKSLDQVDGGMAKLGATAKKAAGAAAVGLVAFGASAIKAGSDLDETLSKSNTVFGESADEIEAWADTAAGSFGQSKEQALAAASSFGNMFTQLGIGQEQAADMSQQMTELASDFASFHNADITQVIEAQSAAFRGEYDSLQRFVPTINAAAVEQEALAQTGKQVTTELTAQEKALAVQTLMMEGAGDAAGDFDRTSDSLANRQRILAARFSDVQAQVGTALIPVLLNLADAGADVIGFLKDLPGPAKTALGAFAGAGAAAFAVSKIATTVGNVSESLRNLTGPLRNAEGGLNRFGRVAAGLGLVGVVAGIAAMANEASQTTVDVDGLATALGNLKGEAAENVGETFDAAQAFGELDTVVSKLAETNVIAADRMIAYAEAHGVAGEELQALKDIVDAKRESDVQGAEDQQKYAEEVQGTIAPTEGLTTAIGAQEEALDGLLTATLAQFDSNIGYRRSIDEVESSIATLNETQKEHGTGSEEYQDALLDTESALLGQADAAVRSYEDTVKAAGGTLTAKQKSEIYRGELKKLQASLAPGSPLIIALQRYIDQLGDIPANKTTTISTIYQGTAGKAGSGARVQVRAEGGPVKAGQSYLVGEEGPEMVTMGANGYVTPNGKLGPKVPAGGGGLTVNINVSVPPTMDAGAAGQSITEALAAYVRRNGSRDLQLLLGIQ